MQTEEIDEPAALTALHRFIADQDKVLGLVLKGHLYAEAQLTEALCAVFINPKSVGDAKLKFGQKVELVRAHVLEFADEPLWSALRALNRLRNELAHVLDSEQVDKRVAEFIRLTEADFPNPERLREKPGDVFGQLAGCLAHIFGSLESIKNGYKQRALAYEVVNEALLAKAKAQ